MQTLIKDNNHLLFFPSLNLQLMFFFFDVGKEYILYSQ